MIRIINSGAFAVFNVSVDNHRLIIVGEDAVPIEPTEVGSLQINNGQRAWGWCCALLAWH
jgi:FtsP/CotA-like multicopper oxidase with cupredoxin domain